MRPSSLSFIGRTCFLFVCFSFCWRGLVCLPVWPVAVVCSPVPSLLFFLFARAYVEIRSLHDETSNLRFRNPLVPLSLLHAHFQLSPSAFPSILLLFPASFLLFMRHMVFFLLPSLLYNEHGAGIYYMCRCGGNDGVWSCAAFARPETVCDLGVAFISRAVHLFWLAN